MASAVADVREGPGVGLTEAEAARLLEAGEGNVDTTRHRSTWDVVRSNAITFFNVVLLVLIVALFVVGEFRDGLFVGAVVFANVVVSTYQELRAVRTLREMVALTAPTALVVRGGEEREIVAEEVVRGDLIHLRPGDQVVADGPVTGRAGEVDESLLTGESDSIRKAPGDELLSGSFCVAGDLYYTAERVGNEAYALKLTADARQLVRRMTPLQIHLKRLLRVLMGATIVLTVALLISYSVEDRGLAESLKALVATVTTIVPVGLLLGITVAFAVGAVRVSRAGAIVQDIQAVEALNYADVVCLDKTGTLTANRLTVQGVTWAPGVPGVEGWLGAFAAATADESKTASALADRFAGLKNAGVVEAQVPFSSARRWSAVRLVAGPERRTFVLGAPEALIEVGQADGLLTAYESASARGMRGVAFAEVASLPDPEAPLTGLRPLGLITIGDVLRPEVREAFQLMAELGIEPKIISGDNPQTVSALLQQLQIQTPGGAIAGSELDGLPEEGFAEAVESHSIFGRISPQQKRAIVESLRDQGRFVAMVGDGANDVHALRAADVAVAMESGTSTARAVAGIVLVRDSFSALIRGAQEATFVLGNSARLSKLFVAKSVYAYLLIFATNLLGLEFPFLPRHGSLTAMLALGIPAIFISISIPPPQAGKDYLTNVLRFALPAGISLAIVAMLVQVFVEWAFNQGTEESRTLVSLVIGFTSIGFMIEVLGFEGASFRSLTRPVMTLFLGGLLGFALVLTVYTPWLRDFFDFSPINAGEWAVVGVGTAAALAGQYYVSHHWREIIAFMLATPGKKDRLRGRPA
ncbi:MAG: HAD-IC family P-type ATPase [Chloroflexi bacterium]|nr:HAD-IC family P-type ATPase [Chloroflexota bacterium]